MRYFFPHFALSYPGVRGFSWNFSSPFSSWLAPSFAKKNFKKNLWDQGASFIQTLQIFTVKFKSAGASFSVAWVPETFLARFPVLSSLYSDPRENSHRTREKPLVPRVLFQSDVKKIKGHLNKRCQCQAKPQFVSEESFSWKLKFAISSKRTFHKHYSEWTSNIKLFHVLKVVAWILVSNKTVSLRTSLRRTLISKS